MATCGKTRHPADLFVYKKKEITMYVPYAGDTNAFLNSNNAVNSAISAAVSRIVRHLKSRRLQPFRIGFSKLNLKSV